MMLPGALKLATYSLQCPHPRGRQGGSLKRGPLGFDLGRSGLVHVQGEGEGAAKARLKN